MNWNLFGFPPLFWAFSLALVGTALLFVLPPLLRSRPASTLRARREANIEVYRDQLRELEREHAEGSLGDEEFKAARSELQARLADDALASQELPAQARSAKKLGIGLGLAVPLLAFGLYFQIGNPGAIGETAPASVERGGEIAALLEKARQKAEANPADGKAWLLLGKTYAVMERWGEADRAFGRAAELLPNDAAALASYAESQAMLNKGMLKGRPMELVQRALAINPEEPKALELAGVDAFQQGNYAQTAHYFERLLQLLPPDSPYAADIATALGEARKRAAAAAGKPLDDHAPSQPAPGTISGRVEISPGLQGKVPAHAAIFLFARPRAGGMPVAAVKAAASDLPLKFELNDSMALEPSSRLSSQQEVELVARISASGEAMAKSGDLEGVLAPVKVGARNVRLVIDRVRP